ncbi:hypothetical protein O181_029275 [Austropuccinia psidii MF-1]|uniref:Uncharacterized protein n=1 Tax=Austropuccinia psidii MF-1 TaxID=1389203 RepID=A0A9Q3CUX7_9BASI|nr:hypothetical protein [Austropuccinia psidii MF-1]
MILGPKTPVMEGEEHSREEGRWPRRSLFFSGVVGSFSGILGTALKGPGEDDVGEEENYVEEEQSDSTEADPTPVGVSQGTSAPSLAQSNQPVPHQYEPSLLAIMPQMTQIMANLNASSSSESSRPPSLRTPSLKAPVFFDAT